MQQFEAIDKKRPVILILCIIAAFFAGLGYTWAVVQSPFVAQLGGDSVKSAVVLCYTITVLSSTMSPTIFGALIKKLGPGKTVLLGAVLFGCGYIASGFVTSVILFYVVFGLGTGIGNGLIYPTVMGYTASLFPEKQGTISGVIAGVYGGAAVIWSPLLAKLIDANSLRFALIVVGAISLVVVVIVSLMIRPVPEGYIAYKRAGMNTVQTGTSAGTSTRDLNRGEMVKTGLFYVAIAAFAFGCTSGMMVISQISAIMQESFSMEPTRAALFVSVMSLASMAGRFLWGSVSDHLNKYLTLSIICAVPILTMGILSVSGSLVVSVACLALTALCYGGFGSTITPITADMFGSKYISENYGVMFLAFGFAGLVGPQLAVRLSSGGDYTKAFMAAAVIALISFCLSLVVRKMTASK